MLSRKDPASLGTGGQEEGPGGAGGWGTRKPEHFLGAATSSEAEVRQKKSDLLLRGGVREQR